jgi:CDP-glucose 4,6-dehydratase
MQAHWGPGAEWRSDDAAQPHEAGYLKLDCSKAHAHLAWWPRLKLESSLEWTVTWHRAFLDREDMAAVTEAQLSRYEAIPC